MNITDSNLDFGVSSTPASLLNSDCTSCEITADKSAYWAPTLYYNYPNGTFLEVPHNGGVVYYLGRGPNRNQTVPFPAGLSMISGNPSLRSYDNSTMTWGNSTFPARPISDRVSFACLKASSVPETPYMADTDCPNGMRAQIHYQSCWNGVDLYKPDQSHVAYQTQIDNGICPPTHPIQIPHLFMETMYSVANVPKQAGGQFVWAQGDPTGYGFHADFQNGWDLDVLKQAVNNCLSGDSSAGTIQECPILNSYQTSSASYNCPERKSQIGEQVTGMLSKLPGCISITPGPAAAPASAQACDPSVSKPAIASTVDSAPLTTATVSVGSSWGNGTSYLKYIGCFVDAAGNNRTLKAASTSNTNVMTIDYCASWCQSKGYRLSGVEYGQECYCDNAINPTYSTAGGANGCNWNCGGTMAQGGVQQICGGYGRISIYNNTDPAFGGANQGSSSTTLATSTKSATSTKIATSTTSTKSSASATPTPSTPANYMGCATDAYNNSGRTLNGASISQSNMTAAICQNFCATTPKSNGIGFQYYGTEYGSECYCGNAMAGSNFITTATSVVKNTICNMKCAGSSSGEICGGPSALSLYKNTTYVPPIIKSPIGSYVQKACLTDPNNGGGRALNGFYTAGNTMTADLCVKTCQGRNFKYAGLEYGGE